MTGYFFAIMSEEYKWWAAWVMALFWPLLFVFAGVVKIMECMKLFQKK
jgi:hypothetical protein